MSCLECGAPGYFFDHGLCKRCERECLGIEPPALEPGRCAGLECGRFVAADERYCPDCHDEIYGDDDWYPDDEEAA